MEAGSELTDVRSVLQSYEVQEESEDGDGLLASSSSRSPSLSSIVPGTEAQWGGGGVRSRRDQDSTKSVFLLELKLYLREKPSTSVCY